jgi:Arylsulfatase A and related enzymes
MTMIGPRRSRDDRRGPVRPKLGLFNVRAMLRLLLILAALIPVARGGTGDTRPNIVLILADDLGWSDLGCYGGEIPTPNLDRLAAGGMRFTQFYNNSVCGPSRASLLTGLYAQRVGHSGRHWNEPTDYSRSLTLGEALQRANYHTMMVGKWQDPDLPVHRGFDRFFGPMTSAIISYYDEVRDNPFFLDGERYTLPEDFYLTDALTEHALRFLRDAAARPETARQPFFLYVAHIAPHWPLHAREADIAPHRARYQRGWDDLRQARLARQRALGLIPSTWPLSPRLEQLPHWEDDDHRDWQTERMAAYAAQVASIDRSTGLILEALEKSGQLNNTLVLFVSDNGAAHDGGMVPVDGMFGFAPDAEANRTWARNGRIIKPGSGPDNLPGPADTFFAYGPAWALASNTPFRDLKLTGYEGGIRTPLIAWWPATIRTPGRITSEVGHVFDFMPTFLEIAGGTYPTELDGNRRPLPLDGRSLLPILKGGTRPDPAFLAWQAPRHRALRAGNWKIVSKGNDDPWELFDLLHDGTETTNLADQHRDVVQDLAARWQAWHDDTRVSAESSLPPAL